MKKFKIIPIMTAGIALTSIMPITTLSSCNKTSAKFEIKPVYDVLYAIHDEITVTSNWVMSYGGNSVSPQRFEFMQVYSDGPSHRASIPSPYNFQFTENQSLIIPADLPLFSEKTIFYFKAYYTTSTGETYEAQSPDFVICVVPKEWKIHVKDNYDTRISHEVELKDLYAIADGKNYQIVPSSGSGFYFDLWLKDEKDGKYKSTEMFKLDDRLHSGNYVLVWDSTKIPQEDKTYEFQLRAHYHYAWDWPKRDIEANIYAQPVNITINMQK